MTKSENEFRNLVEYAPCGISIMNPDKTFEFFNSKFTEMFGYTIAEVPDGRTWLNTAFPDEEYRKDVISIWKRDYAESAKIREVSPKIFSVRCKNGKDKIIHFRLVALKNEKELVTYEDITAQKKAEEALSENEEKFRTLVDDAPFGISIMNPDKTFEFFNTKFTEMFGYTVKEVPDGRTWLNTAFPDEEYRKDVISIWKKDYANSAKIREVSPKIFSVRCKNGKDKIIHFRLVALKNEKKLVTYEDITAQKKAEEALSASEEKHRTLVENLNVGIYRYIPGNIGRYIHANAAMANMFGYDSVDEFIKVNAADLYRNKNDGINFVKELIETGFTNDKELRLQKKDGTPIWCSCTANAYFDAKGHLEWIDGIVEDITLRKEYEKQLRYLASHDPLTGLYNRKFFIEALEEELKGAREFGRQVAVGLLDLDGFKQVNDKYGHETGDLILKDVSARLNEFLPDTSTIGRYGGNEFINKLMPDTSTICRYGGDEFIIMLAKDTLPPERMAEVLEDINQAIACPYDVIRAEMRFDLHGHEISDSLKQKVADKLKHTLRDNDYIHRYEEDVLRITLTKEEIPKEKINALSEELSAMLSCPYERVKEKIDFIACSIGVSIFPEDAFNVDTLIKHADRTMYNVKIAHKQGRKIPFMIYKDGPAC